MSKKNNIKVFLFAVGFNLILIFYLYGWPLILVPQRFLAMIPSWLWPSWLWPSWHSSVFRFLENNMIVFQLIPTIMTGLFAFWIYGKQKDFVKTRWGVLKIFSLFALLGFGLFWVIMTIMAVSIFWGFI